MTVERLDKFKEKKSNLGQAQRLEKMATLLRIDILILQKMQQRNIYCDIEKDKIRDVIDGYMRAMESLRRDAIKLRKML